MPLIGMIFGTGLASKLVLAWLIVFFNTFASGNIFASGRSIEPAVVDSCRILGANRRQLLRTLVMPQAAAWIFAILPRAMSASIVGGGQGLGYMITVALGQLEAADIDCAVAAGRRADPARHDHGAPAAARAAGASGRDAQG